VATAQTEFQTRTTIRAPRSVIRRFKIFQTARCLVVLALEMQAVAVGWQVYENHQAPLDLGLVGLAQFLPGIVLFLLAGTSPTFSTAAKS